MLNERIAEFYAFMRERERVRLKKEQGDPWPWTVDPILRQYKFTNVKREHDRTSKFLIETYYKPFADEPLQTVIFNAAVYRYFGTAEFATAAGWWPLPTEHALRVIEARATERMARKERVYTGAYMINNVGIKGPKSVAICRHILADLLTKIESVTAVIQTRWSLEEGIIALSRTRGFSTFTSKEVLLDTRYTNAWPADTPIDKNTWTAMGPGARKGAGYIMTGEIKSLSEKAALDVCRETFAERERYWPAGWVELELADIQFQMCEFAKYMKVGLGLGRPRSLYHAPR